MMEKDSFAELISRLKTGDDAAATEIVESFGERLIVLARKRLSRKLQRKLDPEDVVQSAFKSFFPRQAKGEFEFKNRDDLWNLLVLFTVRKCARKAEHYGTAQRDVGREVEPKVPSAESSVKREAIAREPTPDDAAVLVEAVEELMRPLDERQRTIVSLSLQGYDTAEISKQVGCSRRMVRRVLLAGRRHLERMQLDE